MRFNVDDEWREVAQETAAMSDMNREGKLDQSGRCMSPHRKGAKSGGMELIDHKAVNNIPFLLIFFFPSFACGFCSHVLSFLSVGWLFNHTYGCQCSCFLPCCLLALSNLHCGFPLLFFHFALGSLLVSQVVLQSLLRVPMCIPSLPCSTT